jgi:hypothetical protein
MISAVFSHTFGFEVRNVEQLHDADRTQCRGQRGMLAVDERRNHPGDLGERVVGDVGAQIVRVDGIDSAAVQFAVRVGRLLEAGHHAVQQYR